MPFSGFTKDSFIFFNELSKNNNLEWFRLNKQRFEECLLTPAKLLINDISEYLLFIDSSFRTEPKYNKAIMRIYKDLRFNKIKPLHEFLLINFGRFKLDSSFYVYLNASSLEIGVFINNSAENNFFSQNIEKKRKLFLDTIRKANINKKYSLFKMSKEIDLIKSKVDFEKDTNILTNQKMLLISKVYSLKDKKIYSKKFSVEVLKRFNELYPLLAISYYNNPEKIVDTFFSTTHS